MIISHTHRFIFFSNPKTGSESIRKLLGPFQEEEVVPFWEHRDARRFYPHMTPSEARTAFEGHGLDFGNYFKFACIRNPWTRLVSLYEMDQARRGLLSKSRKVATRGLDRVLKRKGDSHFRRWLTIEERDAGAITDRANDVERWLIFGRYTLSEFVKDASGTELVDVVIRLESLRSELEPVLDQVGLEPELASSIPHVNVRAIQDYSSYYDAPSRDWVATRYAEEIDRFGYEFPGHC